MGETVVGVDFAGPRTHAQQRRKIIAMGAQRVGKRRYEIRADGFNARLTQGGPPGWTADELATALAGPHRAVVAAFDFPFSIPAALLRDTEFAARVGQASAFGSWEAFNRFVAAALPLSGELDFSRFAGWRDKLYWRKRATDVPVGAQPALKDKFQVLFNMTLVGNALLARLRPSYAAVPLEPQQTRACAIEVYPGATMGCMGRRDYKRKPAAAIEAVLAFCTAEGIHVEVDGRVRAFCETYGMDRKLPDPDGSDALIALCTAILQREGRCIALTLEDPDTPLEGAIWVPATR